MFKPARRTQARMRLAIAGPSGSGKTYSALLIARGLVGPEGRIAVIDTERGSASLYADLTPFDVAELAPPFTPERYVEAIRAAEKAGYDAIVIDSLSHAWAGPGGILDLHDAAAAKEKNAFAAWRLVTPRHNDLVDAMLQSPCHVIATMRSKQEYAQIEEGGRKKVVKLGMAPVQRDGMEYEFTVFLDLDASHNAVASKDRTSLFDGLVFRPTEETGRKLREWLEDAEPPATAGARAPDPPAAGPAGKLAAELPAAGSTQPAEPEKPHTQVEPFEGQVTVIGAPVLTEKGWEVKAALDDEAVTLVGDPVESLVEGVYRIKGLRHKDRVKVEEIAPAEPAPQAGPPGGPVKVAATVQTEPRVAKRSKDGAVEEFTWCYAQVDNRRVILIGDAVGILKPGEAATLEGEFGIESGKEVFYVRELHAVHQVA